MSTRIQQVKQNSFHPEAKDFSWPWWPVVPIYPYGRRRTLRQEVVHQRVWTFEQLQGILYVVVPIRMTVVKLETGGLLVYAPVAPTRECLRLVNEVVVEHGQVKYIVLPTISGIEHKVFVGPFARCFPEAEVLVAPHQWSYPLNLPLSWLGLPSKRTKILSENLIKNSTLGEQFDCAILGPLNLGLGNFEEVVLGDKITRTLLVTDTLVSIPENPPAIIQLEPYPLLFHAKNDAGDFVADTEYNRCQGWQRICLFAMYFRPSVLEVIKLRQAFWQSLQAPDRSKKAYFGLFPFKWPENWQMAFASLRGNGRLLVAPILQELILNREPDKVLEWVQRVTTWNFEQIIPCHFDAPIKADAAVFRAAFAFLEKGITQQQLPEEDLSLLREIDQQLCKYRIVPPKVN